MTTFDILVLVAVVVGGLYPLWITLLGRGWKK